MSIGIPEKNAKTIVIILSISVNWCQKTPLSSLQNWRHDILCFNFSHTIGSACQIGSILIKKKGTIRRKIATHFWHNMILTLYSFMASAETLTFSLPVELFPLKCFLIKCMKSASFVINWNVLFPELWTIVNSLPIKLAMNTLSPSLFKSPRFLHFALSEKVDAAMNVKCK